MIVALGGDDIVFGRKGNDVICLGDGRDFGFGNRGNDRIFGESDSDFLFGDKGDDYLNGGTGPFRDYCFGGSGSNTVVACERGSKISPDFGDANLLDFSDWLY